MKKIGFMLLVAAFSLLAFSPPVLAKVDQATKDELKALHRQLAHTKDKLDRQELKQQIKDIKASAHV